MRPCRSSVFIVPMNRRLFLKRSGWGGMAAAAGCSLIPDGGVEPERLFFTASGKTCVIDSLGQGFHELEVSAPGQVTWQPAGFLEDGRVLLLSMEARRDGPGRPFDEYYHQTPTHVWAYDLDRKSLQELATRDRLAPFYAPQLVLQGGRILMQVIRTRPGQTFNMRLDGSDAREFTGPDEGLPYGYSLSPDGERVAFHLASREGYQIWTCDTHGGNRVKVAAQPGHLYFGPSWSPDGQWLVFQDCHAPVDPGHDWSDVCVCRPDGTGLRMLTEGQSLWFAATYGTASHRGGGSNVPVWTQDGHILVPLRIPGTRVPWEYQAQRPDTDHFNRDFKPDQARGGTAIARIDPKTGSIGWVTPRTEGVWDFRATEFPGGGQVAFCRAETGGVPHLRVTDRHNRDSRKIHAGIGPGGLDHPRWLPRDTASTKPGYR
jgi:TolB protein